MAPSDDAIEGELKKIVLEIWDGPDPGREELTVNNVRKRAAAELGLGDGFLASGEWKARSKQFILALVDELQEGEEAAKAAEEAAQAKAEKAEKAKKARAPAPAKNGAKRASTGAAAAGKKKRKAKESSDESEGSDFDETPPKKQKKQKKQPARRGKKKPPVSDDESEEASETEPDLGESEEESPPKKRKMVQRGGKKKVAESEDDDGEDSFAGDGQDESEESEAKSTIDAKPRPRSPSTAKEVDSDGDSPLSDIQDKAEDKPAEVVDEESEMSEVIDEPPKSRRKSKDASAKGASKPKKASSVKTKPPADLSPDDAEIKKLQGYLVKCGVRKIWGFELKKYGDDSKAKIRHLKGMLHDVGMDGRFSEARAREIKERRELEADLGEVEEMNKRWGIASEGRASRSRAPKKSLRESWGSDDSEARDDNHDDDGSTHKAKMGGSDDDEDSEDQPQKTYAKGRGSVKHRADLAFLGDESESD